MQLIEIGVPRVDLCGRHVGVEWNTRPRRPSTRGGEGKRREGGRKGERGVTIYMVKEMRRKDTYGDPEHMLCVID